MGATNAKAIAAELFKSHKSTDEFHITDDEQAFFDQNAAANHAQQLEEKKVIKVTRAEVEAGDDTEKQQQLIAKKIAKLEPELKLQLEKVEESEKAIAAETDEKKKNKLNSTHAVLVGKLDKQNKEMESLLAQLEA